MCESGWNASVPEDPAITFAPHQVAVLVVPPVVPFDVSIPDLVLGGAEHEGRRLYEVQMCAAEPGLIQTSADYGLGISRGLDLLEDAGTIVIPGTHTRDAIDPRVLAALCRATSGGRRLVSICTGTFVLAAAGLLDGRRATTYSLRAHLLRNVGLTPTAYRATFTPPKVTG